MDPSRYGFAVASSLSFIPWAELSELTAGTYVVSVTQLVGVYEPIVLDSFWARPRANSGYALLQQVLAQRLPPNANPL